MKRAVWGIGVAALVGVGVLFFVTLPDVSVLRTGYPVLHYHGPKTEATVTFQEGRPPGWVRLETISSDALGAVLVSEDWAFYQHKGIDLNEIRESIKVNAKRKKFARGGSTITQQVARNVFLTKRKSLWRKLREIVLAMRMERALPKGRILEIYLNIAEWGEGVYGIGAASWHYFQKSPTYLRALEGAYLAMLLPSPVRYSHGVHDGELSDFARRTTERIVQKMVKAGYLTQELADFELSIPLELSNR